MALGADPAEARREAKAHTFRSFLDEVYEPWAKANIRTTKNTLLRLRANFPDLQNKKLGEINAWVAEKWRAARLKAGAKPSTVNRDLDDLRSALAKAVAWGLLEAHPLNGVKRSRTDDNATSGSSTMTRRSGCVPPWTPGRSGSGPSGIGPTRGGSSAAIRPCRTCAH